MDNDLGGDGATLGSVRTLVREHRGRYDLPDLRVHADDEMWGWSEAICSSPAIGRFAYFRSGLAIADMVKALTTWWCPNGPTAILDFACGYGRSLRYTIQDFGSDHVWGAEILPGAVDFVGHTLGAHALASSTNPEDFRPGRTFELIFVSSLFSHLPEATFVRWLRRLHECLTPDGLLVVSVHDEILLPPGAELSPTGIYFQPTTEVESLDPDDYGATVVNEDFVARAIKAATAAATYRRLPTGLCFEQDLYLVPASADADLSTFEFSRGAQGALDKGELREGGLQLEGWAATQDDDVLVEAVDVRIDGEFVLRCRPSIDRPDVHDALHGNNPASSLRSGWSGVVEVPSQRPAGTITVTAVLSNARRDVVWASELSDVCAQLLPESLNCSPASSSSDSVKDLVVAGMRRIVALKSRVQARMKGTGPAARP